MATQKLLISKNSDGALPFKSNKLHRKVQAMRFTPMLRLHLLLCGVAGAGLAVAAALSPSSARAQALPTGGIVMDGQAAIGAAGDHLSVQQNSPTAIISWDQFSVGQSNSVHFDNGSGATLNRVRGNVASQIDGSLTASGSVYLVNPAGIAVGATGRIEAGGSFIGSTLDMTDGEFTKAARGEAYTVKGNSTATVVNAGRIGSLGGDVALIGQSVENTGDISALKGTAALVAGSEVYVQDRAIDGGRFVVKTGGANTQVKNSGSIQATEVELRANGGNVYALAGNRQGIITATGVSARGGRVYLTAGRGGTVEVSQRIVARRVADDGKMSGGEIRVSAKTVRIDAALDASGRAQNSPLLAQGIEGEAGQVSGAGGLVLVEGNDITLDRYSLIDVSGTLGGAALIGGDYQGGANVANNYHSERIETADYLTVEKGARITADASAGNGGKVVLWSDVQTDFSGEITAVSAVGVGGDAEVSGKALLAFNGDVDLNGAEGAGTLLLDPYNLTIVAGSGGSVTPTSNNSTLGVDTLTGQLASANVIVTTGTGGSQAGNIVVNAPISWSSWNNLTLKAANSITINAAVTWDGYARLRLEAGSTIAINAALKGTYERVGWHSGATLYLNTARGSVESPTITTGAGGTINVYGFELETGTWVQKGPVLPAFNAIDFHIGGTLALNLYNPEPSASFVRVTGGTGADPANAYAIADIYGLQGMASVRDKSYKLTTDIDASVTTKWNSGWGFASIGTNLSSFTGNFDGQNHVISGLFMSRSTQDYIGLFGITTGATIKNISLLNGSIRGVNYVGGIVGYNGGTVSDVQSSISVTGSGQNIGGIAGYNAYKIINSTSSGLVIGIDVASYMGGMSGYNSGLISNSHASGTVTTPNGSFIGGLSGYNSGSIEKSDAKGDVKSSGGSYVGGLVGENKGLIASSYATGNNSSTNGEVEGVDYVGGLVGYNKGEIKGTSDALIYSTRNVKGAGTGNSIGGLVGRNNGIIEYAYIARALGSLTNVTVQGTTIVGGLAGYNAGTIKNTEVIGAMVSGTNIVGGLVGQNGRSIESSFSTGEVKGASVVGGLVGYNKSLVTKSYSTGNVSGTDKAIGGLVGENYGQLLIAYASGSVSGKNSVGGLVGINYASISDAYSTGDVTATEDKVGGLAGVMSGGSIDRTYAKGSVTLASGNLRIGGLVGYFEGGTISSSLWNSSANQGAGQAKSGVGATTGRNVNEVIALTNDDFHSTARFMSKASRWNFNNIWAPSDKDHNPELYALSKIIRIHSFTPLDGVTYGDEAVNIDNPTLFVNSIIYGAGTYSVGANASSVYDKTIASYNFGTQTGASIERLDAGRYVTSIGGTGKTDIDQGYRLIYTAGVTVAKKSITLDANAQKTYDGSAWTGVGYAPVLSADSELAFGQNLEDLGDLSLTGNGVGAINAGKYTLGLRFDNSGTAKNYNIQLANSFLNIDKAKIKAEDIMAINQTIQADKVYDGSSQFKSSTYATIGGVNGETLTIRLLNGKYDSVDAGNTNVTGAWSISSVTGGLARVFNYELETSVFSNIATITPATIKLSGQIFNANKTYDGEDGFSLADRQISSGINNEYLTLSLTNGKYATANAGITTVSGTWVISDPGKGNGKASNYIIEAGSEAVFASATIKQATLDLKNIINLKFNADKVYDGGSDYNLAPISFNTGIKGETLSASLSNGKYSSPNAGKKLVTGKWDIADETGLLANYKISGLDAAQYATIAKAKLDKAFIDAVSASLNPNKVYDGRTQFTPGAVQGISTGINGETLTLTLLNGKYDAVNAGSATVTGNWRIAGVAGGQGNANNYELESTDFSRNATISQATIDLSNQKFRADKIYDGLDAFSLANKQINTGINGERLTLGLINGKYSSPNAGNVIVNGTWQLADAAAGKGKSSNYIILGGTETAAVNATINQAFLNLGSVDSLKFNANKVYDGNQVYTLAPITFNTGINGETLTASLLGGKYANANAGTNLVTGTWDLANASGSLANYKISGVDVRRSAQISKAALIVTANDVTAAYTGKSWTGGTVNYTGFVNGETESVLSGQLSWRGSGNMRDIGSYTITPTGLTSRNYQLTYVSGTLTIQ